MVFGAMTPAFRTDDTPAKYIHVLWYVVIMIESIGIVAISCCWRMLSFKKTHFVERMGLLTLIVIGEGAIGVTKTVGRVMGKSGVDVEGCFLIMCIILVLVRCLGFLLQVYGLRDRAVADWAPGISLVSLLRSLSVGPLRHHPSADMVYPSLSSPSRNCRCGRGLAASRLRPLFACSVHQAAELPHPILFSRPTRRPLADEGPKKSIRLLSVQRKE